VKRPNATAIAIRGSVTATVIALRSGGGYGGGAALRSRPFIEIRGSVTATVIALRSGGGDGGGAALRSRDRSLRSAAA
jgi:hypothetical protein